MYFRFKFDGVLYDAPMRGIEDFGLILSRKNGIEVEIEDVFREIADTSGLEFAGSVYCFFCDKKRENQCDVVLIEAEIAEEIEGVWDSFFTGYVYLSNVAFNHHRKIVKIERLVDASYSGKLLRYVDKEVSLFTKQSINCTDITQLPIYDFGFAQQNGTYSYIAKGFKVHELFDFLVRYCTDNTMYVVSNYLPTLRLAVGLGGSLQGMTAIDKVYPRIALKKLFIEIRKKYNIHTAVEYDVSGNPYIRIENDSYFFDNTNELFEEVGLPYDLEESTDMNAIYSSIKIGVANNDLSDNGVEARKIKDYTAWNEEEYLSCSNCINNNGTGSVLNLVSDWQIDGNVILDTIQNGGNEDTIFMWRYGNTTVNIGGVSAIGVSSYFDSQTGHWYHNKPLTNEEVVARWFSTVPECFTVSRYSPYSFRAVNDNTPDYTETFIDKCDAVRFQGIGFFPNAINRNTLVSFEKEEYDIASLYTHGIYEPLVGFPQVQGNGVYSYYTIPVNGQYSFKAEINPIVDNSSTPSPYAPSQIDYIFSINVYQDNTLSTLLFTNNISASDLSPSVGINMQVTSPLWTLNTGNIVLCNMNIQFQLLNGFNTTIYFLGGSFELLEDTNSCVNINETPNITKTTFFKYDKKLCYEDYLYIKQNKYKYITINGRKAWVRRIEYQPNAKSTLVLVSNESMC